MKAKFIITLKIRIYGGKLKKYALARDFYPLGFNEKAEAQKCVEKLNEWTYLNHGEYCKIYRVEYASRNSRFKKFSLVNSEGEFFENYQTLI